MKETSKKLLKYALILRFTTYIKIWINIKYYRWIGTCILYTFNIIHLRGYIICSIQAIIIIYNNLILYYYDLEFDYMEIIV